MGTQERVSDGGTPSIRFVVVDAFCFVSSPKNVNVKDIDPSIINKVKEMTQFEISRRPAPLNSSWAKRRKLEI
jgi:hypothetical protein